MHIPDGFLSTPVWATFNVISVPAIGWLARSAQSKLEDNRIPLMGVLGAFVFAAQMINFPVAAGASGHLLGGALLACTIGPAAGVIVMTAILAIQAFVFQDGGVLALGANAFNLGLVGVFAGYLPYRLWGGGRFRRAAIFLGGFVSVLASGCLALAQVAVSGVPMPRPMLGLAVTLFFVNALIEGGVTLAVVQAIEKINSRWIVRPQQGRPPAVAILGGIAILLAGAGFIIASAHPDSLETVADHLGIAANAKALIDTPFADYQFAAARSDLTAKATAGLLGLLIVWLVCVGLGRLVAQRRSE
jgi:cobalt/nickel transport system permease protein